MAFPLLLLPLIGAAIGASTNLNNPKQMLKNALLGGGIGGLGAGGGALAGGSLLGGAGATGALGSSALPAAGSEMLPLLPSFGSATEGSLLGAAGAPSALSMGAGPAAASKGMSPLLAMMMGQQGMNMMNQQQPQPLTPPTLGGMRQKMAQPLPQAQPQQRPELLTNYLNQIKNRQLLNLLG